MIICQINRKHLAFEFDPTTYKGIRIGDAIRIPEYQSEDLITKFVIVTGFNLEHDIIHWKAKSKYGNGIAHSGSYYDDIIQHIRIRS
jgi:hypothetical protein